MDEKIINFLKSISIPFARFSVFLVYFWFGILKLLGYSPATELVFRLYEKTNFFTQYFSNFHTFFLTFSLFEILIGILFLIKGLERIVLPLLIIHLITTILPLFLLGKIIWVYPFVPTLEGQYIIKNILIIGIAIFIFSYKKNKK